jgi:hypothetical protein
VDAELTPAQLQEASAVLQREAESMRARLNVPHVVLITQPAGMHVAMGISGLDPVAVTRLLAQIVARLLETSPALAKLGGVEHATFNLDDAPPGGKAN